MNGIGGIRRRSLLGGGVGTLVGPYLLQGSAQAQGRWASYPFTLGVASGAPSSSGVVLWTRLAPAPLQPDGGMPPQRVPVHWQVADDEGFTRIVAQGVVFARPEDVHTVHVEVTGLRPGRWYFYRFRSGDAVSRAGRTRTLPAAAAHPGRLRMAVVSCQRGPVRFSV
ncbi:alkaline phosphatase D family protein [Micromonospora sp. NPDC048830]|uniref:alkaline phosphatase D family protein n=1 Tax=Micromonospora sp. NPDC048830 TaxID=3364257 RepID=UPI0037229090